MKLIMMTIHDSKAEAFIQPFYAATPAVGIRMFKQTCNDPSSNFAMFPGDYTLFEIGTFDCSTGKVEMLDVPENHGLAIQYQTQKEN